MGYVEVQLICGQYVLLSVFPQHTFVLCTGTKLIDMIDMAQQLQVHICNLDEFTLTQYTLN